MTSQPVAFVRKASGLRRDVSLLDVVSLNLSNMSGGAALGVIGFTTVLLASTSGVNLVYGSILAWLLSIPQIIVYTMMTTRISRTGGDYIWASRVYGGFFGGSLSFMGYTLETMAYLALIALAAVVSIGSVGLSLGYENMLSLALPGNIPGANLVGQFVIAAIIFAALIAVNILKPKAGYKIVAVAVIIAIAATFVGIFTLLATGTTGVQNYMSFLNTIGANATYTSVASSYSGPTFDLSATIFMLPFFSIFVYPWLNAGPAVASEIKGKGALRYNVLISSIVTLVVVTAAFASMYYAGGFAFINGALANPNLVYNYSFNFWTLAMGVSSNMAVSWFIGLGWILWNVAILAYGIIVLSRYLFAQSFDRFLPEKIAYVSPKHSSPVVALVIELVGTRASDWASFVLLRYLGCTLWSSGRRNDLLLLHRSSRRNLRLQERERPIQSYSSNCRSTDGNSVCIHHLPIPGLSDNMGRKPNRIWLGRGQFHRRNHNLCNFEIILFQAWNRHLTRIQGTAPTIGRLQLTQT